MTHRVEEAKSNRSGCKNTECAKAGLKIAKGELRLGTLVEIKENTTWHWKHWGCVTPLVLERWKEANELDPDLIDGYSEISGANQQRVMRALRNGHVDDEDWRGDIEKNRPGQKGFRTPKGKAQANGADIVNVPEEDSPTKKPSKAQDEAAQLDMSDESADEKPKKKRGKAAKEREATSVDHDKPTKKRGRPSKKADSGEKAEEPASKKSKAVKKTPVESAASKPATRRQGRSKKKVEDE